MDTAALPLQRIFLFDGIDFAAADKKFKISSKCVYHNFSAGEVILSAEHRTDALCVIGSGKVRIESGSDSHTVVLRYAAAGETFGAAHLFSEALHRTRVVADCDSEIIMMPQSLILSLINSLPHTAVNYLKFLSERVNFLNKKIAAFTAGSAEAKLAVYLLSQPKSSEAEGDGYITCAVSMSSLAGSLGIARASLYRAIETLSKADVIIYDGRRFKITDYAGLEEIIA